MIRCCRPTIIKHLLVPKKALLLAAVGWTVLVTLLCLVSFNELPKVGLKSADKFVHVFFHFVFTMLWILYLKAKDPNGDMLRISSRIVFWSVVFGIVIEMGQELLTETRRADFYDLAANFTGAIVAVVVLGVYQKIGKNNLNKNV